MARAVSLAKYNALERKIKGMQNRVKRAKEVADDKIQYAVRVAEVSMAGGLVGVYEGLRQKKGETGEWAWGGIPASLILGAVAHGMGLVGIGGDKASHLHAFGDGFVSVGMYQVGKGIGKEGIPGLREGWAGLGAGNQLPYAEIGGQRLTDEELEALS